MWLLCLCRQLTTVLTFCLPVSIWSCFVVLVLLLLFVGVLIDKKTVISVNLTGRSNNPSTLLNFRSFCARSKSLCDSVDDIVFQLKGHRLKLMFGIWSNLCCWTLAIYIRLVKLNYYPKESALEELISLQNTSHKQNNKELNRLRLWIAYDSGLCCCACVTSVERQLNPLCWFRSYCFSWFLFCFFVIVFGILLLMS